MRIKEVLSDHAFVKSLLEKESVLEVQIAFEKKGFNFSELDIMNIWYHIKRRMDNRGRTDELPLEQLDSVAGGCEAVDAIGSYLSANDFYRGIRW